uniref:Uncharacterized protein n=1 Tax=Salix viminalis TaxID=40686 RepID=A0A6N2KD33_SALVM
MEDSLEAANQRINGIKVKLHAQSDDLAQLKAMMLEIATQQSAIVAMLHEEGWLLPNGSDSLNCTQTLELKNSAEPGAEEAFCNQVVALSQMGLILPANAKKNAIYVVHLDYGPNPASTRLDYISEFTVTMPILSLIGTSDVVHGQFVAQVYCVQTQAIQQYALELCQCLSPLLENMDVLCYRFVWVQFFLGGGEWLKMAMLPKPIFWFCGKKNTVDRSNLGGGRGVQLEVPSISP